MGNLLKSYSGYSSVGRASDCRFWQRSDGPWFDSGWPDVPCLATLCGQRSIPELWLGQTGGRERERESKHWHSGELISIMLGAYIEMHASIQHVGGVGRRLPRFFVSKYDSLAEWSKALASGASPQGRGLEPHSCHIAPQTRSLRRMYPKRKRSHNPKFLTTDQNPNPKV